MFVQRLIEVVSAFRNCPVRLSFSKKKFILNCIENIVEVGISCPSSDSFCLPDGQAKRIICGSQARSNASKQPPADKVDLRLALDLIEVRD